MELLKEFSMKNWCLIITVKNKENQFLQQDIVHSYCLYPHHQSFTLTSSISVSHLNCHYFIFFFLIYMTLAYLITVENAPSLCHISQL